MDDLKERLLAVKNNSMYQALNRITELEAQLAARDAEIVAWLRDQYTDELGGIDYTAGWIADAIEAGAYRSNPQ